MKRSPSFLVKESSVKSLKSSLRSMAKEDFELHLHSVTCSLSQLPSNLVCPGGSRFQFSLASSVQHRQCCHCITSAGPAPSRISSMRLNLHLFLTVSPRLESPLRFSLSISPNVHLQASDSDVFKSGVRGVPHLTRILDSEYCRLSRLGSPYVSSISTVIGFPTPLVPPLPSTPPGRQNSSSFLLGRYSSQFIGFFDRGSQSSFGHEMVYSYSAMGLTIPIRLQGLHLFLAVSQPTSMWGGLVPLTNSLKMFGGFTNVFTETDLSTKFHFSCSKSSYSLHLPVGSPGSSSSLSSLASFLRSYFPPILWRCLSISITGLLSCGAVRSGPEDAAEFVSTNFRGADWKSTSQFKVTISLLSDHVVKATLTHSSTVLSSLSFSSFEDLSFLSYVVVVYAFKQRGWTIPSNICIQVI